MIIKFLYTRGPNGHFPAVGYSTGKVDKNKGELMKVANFGSLQGLGQLRPQDYKNHLKMISSTNKAVKKPQLHVAISGEGKSCDKHELTEIATQWLEKMGYGKQPYLIIFHKDTRNNHVHVVSTRVDKQGKKISDSYEQIKGLRQMNIVMGLDEKRNAKADIAKALTYHFGTKAQFMMILERKGYALREVDGKFQVIKFGRLQDEIDLGLVVERFKNYNPNLERRTQLKALFHKYVATCPTALTKGISGYTSEFSTRLKEKLGLELIFHASGNSPPYGYTIIDHATKTVFKGGEIMPLKEMMVTPQGKSYFTQDSIFPAEMETVHENLDDKFRGYYAAILKAALYNYPDLMQGLMHQGLFILRNGEQFTLHDPGAGVSMDAGDLLNDLDYNFMTAHFKALETDEDISRHHVFIPEPYIAQDIDDEAIHGRRRRRKKAARASQR